VVSSSSQTPVGSVPGVMRSADVAIMRMRVIGLAPLHAGSWRRASDDPVAVMAATKARQDRASIMRLFDPSMVD
jgi:hypothetical protein